MQNVKIGLIGCGKQALKHISGLRKVPGVQLVLADINPDYAVKLGQSEKLPYVTKIDDLFADPEIKAIDICTPTNSHIELISHAINSGRNYFCEKPLCEKLAQAQELQKLLDQNHSVGMIGYVYRFSPVFEMGKRLFEDISQTKESGVLGKVTSAFFRLGGRGSHQLWKHRKDQGGGAINEMLVHMLDLALWYFGPVKEVETLVCELLRPQRVIQGKLEEVDAEDYVLVRLKMHSGVDVLCQADLVTPAFTQFIEIQGENGTFMGSIQPDMPSFIFCQQDIAGFATGKTVLNLGERNLFEAQMAEFIRVVRSQKEPSRCTLKDSLLLLDVLEKIKKEN